MTVDPNNPPVPGDGQPAPMSEDPGLLKMAGELSDKISQSADDSDAPILPEKEPLQPEGNQQTEPTTEQPPADPPSQPEAEVSADDDVEGEESQPVDYSELAQRYGADPAHLEVYGSLEEAESALIQHARHQAEEAILNRQQAAYEPQPAPPQQPVPPQQQQPGYADPQLQQAHQQATQLRQEAEAAMNELPENDPTRRALQLNLQLAQQHEQQIAQVMQQAQAQTEAMAHQQEQQIFAQVNSAFDSMGSKLFGESLESANPMQRQNRARAFRHAEGTMLAGTAGTVAQACEIGAMIEFQDQMLKERSLKQAEAAQKQRGKKTGGPARDANNSVSLAQSAAKHQGPMSENPDLIAMYRDLEAQF